MIIEIDSNSGFCHGVVTAIEKAENELKKSCELYCLGDLVHNSLEMERLRKLGLQTIDHKQLSELKNKTVMLRAHGEPPSTYQLAKKNAINIVDATCPVVLHLQSRIHKCYEELKNTDSQLVIYGKRGHAEVNGLVGQTDGTAIVIENEEDLKNLDFGRAIFLFSQTTKPLDGFRRIVEIIKSQMKKDVEFQYFDTICRQVANRLPKIKDFAARHDFVYFVAGRKSSNGKMLYEECRNANRNVFFISDASEITDTLPADVRSVGICGATSTPKWLMEEVEKKLSILNASSANK